MTDPRIAADKLTGPSRPHFPCIRRKDLWWLEETPVYDHMDAQDARIADLEKDRNTWKELCNLESKENEELEREIREAHVLLVDWDEFDQTENWVSMRSDWLARNAEKEQGK